MPHQSPLTYMYSLQALFHACICLYTRTHTLPLSLSLSLTHTHTHIHTHTHTYTHALTHIHTLTLTLLIDLDLILQESFPHMQQVINHISSHWASRLTTECLQKKGVKHEIQQLNFNQDDLPVHTT